MVLVHSTEQRRHCSMYLLSSHFIGTSQEHEVDFLTPTEMPLGLLSMDIPRLLKLRASKAGLSLLPPVKPSSICPSLKFPVSAAQDKIWLLAWNLPVPTPPQPGHAIATLSRTPDIDPPPPLCPPPICSIQQPEWSSQEEHQALSFPVTDSTLPVFACSALLSSFGNSTPISF